MSNGDGSSLFDGTLEEWEPLILGQGRSSFQPPSSQKDGCAGDTPAKQEKGPERSGTLSPALPPRLHETELDFEHQQQSNSASSSSSVAAQAGLGNYIVVGRDTFSSRVEENGSALANSSAFLNSYIPNLPSVNIQGAGELSHVAPDAVSAAAAAAAAVAAASSGGDDEYLAIQAEIQKHKQLQIQRQIQAGSLPVELPIKKKKASRARVNDLAPEFVHRCPFDGCTKKFAKKYNLKIHVRRHAGDLPFQCDIQNCGKRFMWHSSFQRHQRSHLRKPKGKRKKTKAGDGMSSKNDDVGELRHVKTPGLRPISPVFLARHTDEGPETILSAIVEAPLITQLGDTLSVSAIEKTPRSGTGDFEPGSMIPNLFIGGTGLSLLPSAAEYVSGLNPSVDFQSDSVGPTAQSSLPGLPGQLQLNHHGFQQIFSPVSDSAFDFLEAGLDDSTNSIPRTTMVASGKEISNSSVIPSSTLPPSLKVETVEAAYAQSSGDFNASPSVDFQTGCEYGDFNSSFSFLLDES
eukprot:Plantae.Rhodophyta-Palmaria_palmata.ctg2179.p1 GENE.Plantae.Rhodophyta-Palmaria_palmata.ctg2179~~Plantae.Rhodophyta-Palmaria_palmata.ctg2179.p1  ORF type:complete len:519 (+),score=95.03 Plantae.Rhodophyta-Palmaria_palmata.ctg2179:94-1650(+)